MEGPLSRVKSIKKSLRQSFRRIRRSRVSLRKHHVTHSNKVASALRLWSLSADRSRTRPLTSPLLSVSSLSSSRRPTRVWRLSWQRWSWLLSRGRSRPAPQTTRSPASYGPSTSQTPSSQTVSNTTYTYTTSTCTALRLSHASVSSPRFTQHSLPMGRDQWWLCVCVHAPPPSRGAQSGGAGHCAAG